MKLLLSAAIAALALSTPALSATVNLVKNGSFEAGTPGNQRGLANDQRFNSLDSGGGATWDIYTSLDAWHTASGGGIEVQTKRTLGLTPDDGRAYVELDSNRNSAMSQVLKLKKGSYKLSFAYSPRTGDAATNGISYAIGNLTFGSVTGPSKAEGTAVGVWTTVERIFNVKDAGKFSLTFAATGRSDSYGGLLDDVQVSAVPVPAAGLLMLGALGGLAGLRRRKKA